VVTGNTSHFPKTWGKTQVVNHPTISGAADTGLAAAVTDASSAVLSRSGNSHLPIRHPSSESRFRITHGMR